MIWKILFVLTVLFIAYVCVALVGESVAITDFSAFAGYFLMTVSTLSAGYFYALGWKKRLYSDKANKIIFGVVCAYILFVVALSVHSAIPVVILGMKRTLVGNVSDHSVYWTAFILVTLISFVMYSIMWLPSVVAYFKYKKHNQSFAVVERPYWKLFITSFFVITVLSQLATFFSAHRIGYNLYDYLVQGSIIIDALFLFGFAYNIKIFNKLFWKIIAVPYILFSIGQFFFCSSAFNNDMKLELLTSSVVATTSMIAFVLVYFYVLYRYAFTSDVFKPEISEKTTEENID